MGPEPENQVSPDEHPETKRKVDALQSSIHYLEKDLIGIRHVLENQEKVLTEMKNIMVIQTKSLEEITRVKDRVHYNSEEIEHLTQRFNDRLKETEPLISDYQRFRGKMSGIAIASLFFFALIQGLFAFGGKTMYEELKDQRQAVGEIKERTSSLELDVIYTKERQNFLEDRK